MYLLLISSETLIHQVFAFNEICVPEEEGEPEEKSEEEIEIIEGQEEGNKSNKSGSEDEVSRSQRRINPFLCLIVGPNLTSIKAAICFVKGFFFWPYLSQLP